MMTQRRLAWFAALAVIAAVVSACSLGGISLNRSLYGELAPARVLPAGQVYFIGQLDLTSDALSASGAMAEFGPGFTVLTLANEGDGLRITDARDIGLSFGIPAAQRRDTKFVYAVPGGFEQYVFELSGRNERQERVFVAFFAQRRCDGQTCVLALMGDTLGDGRNFRRGGHFIRKRGASLQR